MACRSSPPPHGGPPDIVASLRHGRVADPHDPVAFAGAIHALLDDPSEWTAASAAGRRNARRLDGHAYADRFVAIARGLRDAPFAHRRPERLLPCDIDNTLTGCRHGAAELCEVLGERPEIGFGIATGRSLQEAQRLLREWGYPDPMVMVTSVGSEICWRAGGRLIADHDFAAAIGAGWDGDAIDRIGALITGLSAQPPVEQRRFKRSWFGGAGAAARLRLALGNAALPVRVIHSHGDLIDVVPLDAGKGEAMRWAAGRLELPLARVHAAGDSGNDLDMLEICPNPIIVANHSHELAGLASRRGIRIADRPHAGGIVDAMRRTPRLAIEVAL